MRVLAVLFELRLSGAEVSLHTAAPEWPSHGVEMEVLSVAPHVGAYAPTLEDAGYPVHHVPLRPLHRFVPEYLRLLRRGRFDVVHVHPELGNVATAGLARLAGRRVVRTAHNVRSFAGLLKAERRVQRRVLRSLGVVHVAVGTSVALSEWRRFGNPTHRILNCFDQRRFSRPSDAEREAARAELGVGPDEFVVVTVGNCAAQKNHEAAIEAVAALAEERQVRYFHAGTEEPGRPERELARRRGLADRACFLGPVDDIVPLLRAADCHLMPSRFEGLSLASLEALACGVPSVLADVPGLRDLRDVVPGIRWAQPSGASVAEGLRDVAGLDEGDRHRLSRDMAAATARHFSVATFARRYAEVYRGAVAVPR